jgi:pyruvate kinase
MVYDVIATLGPATSKKSDWQDLLRSGASRFRLNTSHLTPKDVERWITALEQAFREDSPSIVLDLQGSKWRLGAMASTELKEGDEVTFGLEVEPQDPARSPCGQAARWWLPVPHRDFFEAAAGGAGLIRLNDARVELEINSVGEESLSSVVRRGGPVSSRKGISIPGSTFRREGLLPKDAEILRRTAGAHGVSYALSYVRDGEELTALAEAIPTGAMTIAKVERPEAVEAARQISELCDEVWLCRGDLGAEVGGVEMAQRVYQFSRELEDLEAPAVLAGQVLEHMTASPQPTRSELCHLYDALRKGYRGVVLSDETAVGRYPLDSCRTAAAFR